MSRELTGMASVFPGNSLRKMCILFLWTASDPEVGGYKLILAANRDESFSRPAKRADFWPGTNIVGGQDMPAGREGGTWLAMTKTGKIGVLLSMPPRPEDAEESKLRRGFLVNNFLTWNSSSQEYLNVLKKQCASYHAFNLLTIDLRSKENLPDINYFSNYPSDSSATEHFEVKLEANQAHSFGNCSYDEPFEKVTEGQVKFEHLVSSYDTSNEASLIQGLLKMLKSTYKYYPDPALTTMADAMSTEFARGLSSVFNYIPSNNFGSRTHTIILIDSNDHVKFLEWTMKEPILDPVTPTWLHSCMEFDLNSEQN